MLRLLVAAAACTLAAVVPGGATSAGPNERTIDPAEVFAKQIQALHRKTTVPILLPGSIPRARTQRLYASGWAGRRGWGLSLATRPRCGGATACFFASFGARRGQTLPRPANLALANGAPAHFKPITCGGSCSPATLWFVHRGVLHDWQLTGPPPGGRRAIASLASSAIAAGPR
jgi:hypothetical protein